MKPDAFIKVACDAREWTKKARSLRRSGDALWDLFGTASLSAIDSDTKALDRDKWAEATSILRNCQFLYSLSAECALKGLIIKRNPQYMTISTTVDGSGTVIEAMIKRIGSSAVDMHNLERLAEAAGVLHPGERPEERELLAFSSNCITWLGRYPVPMGTESIFEPRGTLPYVVFNHYYRDAMDPFLDELFELLDEETKEKTAPM